MYTYMLLYEMSFKVLELILDSGVSPYTQWFAGYKKITSIASKKKG